MPVIPNPDPGLLVTYWDTTSEGERFGEAMCRFFAADKSVEARKFASARVEMGDLVRVFALVEVFHATTVAVRRLEDNMQPVVDHLLREQQAGRGLTSAARRAPTMTPEAVMDKYAARQLPTPLPEKRMRKSLFGDDE